MQAIEWGNFLTRRLSRSKLSLSRSKLEANPPARNHDATCYLAWIARLPWASAATLAYRVSLRTSAECGRSQGNIVRLDDDENVDDKVEVSVLRCRQVTDEESGLWPGMFVGHPIAFIQPDGIGMDEWTFGLVTGYHMFKHQPWLHIRCKEDAKKIKLEQPPNVIKVDWINYVLQTGAGSNASTTNAGELLVLTDEACAQWGKSRGALPPKLLSTVFRLREMPWYLSYELTHWLSCLSHDSTF